MAINLSSCLCSVTGVLFDLLVVNWRHLVDVVFADDSSLKVGCHYDVVMYSFCRLWSRMIKACSCRPGRPEVTDDGCYACIVDSTTVLLDRLKSGQLPAPCRGKCLAVLMQTAWFDPSCSTPVATWRVTNAESVLNVLYSCCLDDDSSPHISSLFDTCLLVDNHHPDVTGSPTTCGRSEFFTADNHICTTVRKAEVETATPASTENPHSVAVATSASAFAASEHTSSFQNTGLTTSQGLSSGLQAYPTSYTSRLSSGEFCGHKAVLYDAKLVRKFVLLVLRCLDIVTRENSHHSKPYYSLFAVVVYANKIHNKTLYWLIRGFLQILKSYGI